MKLEKTVSEGLQSLDLNSMKTQQPQDDTITFVPQGVCSKLIQFKVKDGCLHDVHFTGGCPGNLEGIGKLIEGMPLNVVANRLKGIRCGRKATSCPDQLVQAIEPYM